MYNHYLNGTGNKIKEIQRKEKLMKTHKLNMINLTIIKPSFITIMLEGSVINSQKLFCDKLTKDLLT